MSLKGEGRATPPPLLCTPMSVCNYFFVVCGRATTRGEYNEQYNILGGIFRALSIRLIQPTVTHNGFSVAKHR